MNKILIIDDDRELCALIKHSVQSEHIEADFCNTGKEGLQKLKEQEYQLVVLDVMMPGMDGFETLEEIRKDRGIRQEELALALGVSRQTIGSLENGRYNPSIILAFKIARYFGMQIEDIFIYEEEDG